MNETVVHLAVEARMMFGERKMSPEEIFIMRIIEAAIDYYLCGMYDDEIIYFNRRAHRAAKEFIFGDNIGFKSFAYYWELKFPHIDVNEVKKALEKQFEKRFEKWRKNGKNNNNDGRGRKAGGGDNDRDTGDHQGDPVSDGIRLILFS